MFVSPMSLPSRVRRKPRVVRAALAAAVGGLLLLGSACVEASEVGDVEPSDVGEPSVALFAGDSSKGVDWESLDVNGRRATLIEGEWTSPDESASAAVADAEPELPEWVKAKLESSSELPKLKLISPESGAFVEDSYVLFSGFAEPGATVVAGPFSAVANDDGVWSLGLIVSGGKNVVTFSTTNEDGVGLTASVTIYFESKEGTHDEKPDGYEKPAYEGFQAWQKYGTCSEPVPYDVFKGRATPGTLVTVSSPYGGGKTEANDDGYWHIEVEFPEAPFGEPFTVVVTNGEVEKAFTFTRKGSDGYEKPLYEGFEVWQKYGVSREVVPYEVFEGRAKPGTLITASSPYGESRTESNDDGGWRMEVEFPEAPIGQTFEVVLRNGEFENVLTFTWKGPEAHDFKAWQKSGFSTGPVPYDVFEGHAAPGTLVTASSPYGEGRTESNDDGVWRIEVEFPEAPIGETFEVVLSNGEFEKVFTFTRKS